MSVDLLLITYNRRQYAEKTVNRLLNSHSDFRLYWWDNGSTDGVGDWIEGLSDPRIALRHRHPTNVMQAQPTFWFLRNARADVVGKVDDDTLVPEGWLETIASAIREERTLGMIGCWTFQKEDFTRNEILAGQKLKKFGRHTVLSNIEIGGTSVLIRRDLAERYLMRGHTGTAFPIDRARMSAEGIVSGWYYPLLIADHMDDPRSANFDRSRTGGSSSMPLSARLRGITNESDFSEWIARDADSILRTSTEIQIKGYLAGLGRRKRLAVELRRLLNRLLP